MKHRLPDKILAAARHATVDTAPPADPESAVPPTPGAVAGASLDLTAIGVGEGEAVRQARQIVAANFTKLTEAYAAQPPDVDGVTSWQVRWEKSVEALRKQERDDRDAQKARGHLVSRPEVEAELAQMLEALRLMREAMPDKIIAQLSIRAADRLRRILRLLEPDLRDAILTVRARESDLLLNLATLGSREEAATALTAAPFTLAA